MFLITGHGFNFKTSNSLENTDLVLATVVTIILQVNHDNFFLIFLVILELFMSLMGWFNSTYYGNVSGYILIWSQNLK